MIQKFDVLLQLLSGLIDLAYALDLPLVASNEPYFATREDFAAHDALICIAEGEVITSENRRRLTPEHFFKSGPEMEALLDSLVVNETYFFRELDSL